MVKVRYSEGVAIHTDPESCAGHCRDEAGGSKARSLRLSRQPFVNRAVLRSSHGRDANPCGAGSFEPFAGSTDECYLTFILGKIHETCNENK